MKKVIITAPAHPLLTDVLTTEGYVVSYLPAIDYNTLSQQVHDATGLVVTTRIKIDHALLQKAGKLQWIGRLGSGIELFDVLYARERGIQLISTPEGNRNAVAEHTLGLLLNLLNNISHSFSQVKKGIWLRNENRGTELKGKTVGVIGYGNAGAAFAALLAPFGVKVLAYDKYKTGFAGGHVYVASLKDVCDHCHVISLHIPLSENTRYFANSQLFNALKQKPFFISTCRGEVTNTGDLIQALKNQQLAGVALDVLENEKLESFSENEKAQMAFLTSQSNVILTPHIAGYSHQAFRRMAEVLLQKLGLPHQ